MKKTFNLVGTVPKVCQMRLHVRFRSMKNEDFSGDSISPVCFLCSFAVRYSLDFVQFHGFLADARQP
jgi:hypothetical protein